MRKRYGLNAAREARAAEQRRIASVPIPSLEEELARVHQKINLRDFEYKPVPRPPDDEG